jgi:hypothetical protein
MSLAESIPPDELQLARLTASKLSKVVNGLVSVGTGCLMMPSPLDFLAGRDRTPLGFVEVLRCIGVKPGHADKIPLLREQADQLARSIQHVHAGLLRLASWRSLPAPEIHEAVEQLCEGYEQFCARLGNFSALLGLEADSSAQARVARVGLEGLFHKALPV